MLTTEKEMKKDTGMMLEKQDKTIGAVREVSEKIDRCNEDIVTEINKIIKRNLSLEKKALPKKHYFLLIKHRFSFVKRKSVMEERFERIEREIGEIKAKIGLL